jgi:hypothetical protein
VGLMAIITSAVNVIATVRVALAAARLFRHGQNVLIAVLSERSSRSPWSVRTSTLITRQPGSGDALKQPRLRTSIPPV